MTKKMQTKNVYGRINIGRIKYNTYKLNVSG